MHFIRGRSQHAVALKCCFKVLWCAIDSHLFANSVLYSLHQFLDLNGCFFRKLLSAVCPLRHSRPTRCVVVVVVVVVPPVLVPVLVPVLLVPVLVLVLVLAFVVVVVGVVIVTAARFRVRVAPCDRPCACVLVGDCVCVFLFVACVWLFCPFAASWQVGRRKALCSHPPPSKKLVRGVLVRGVFSCFFFWLFRLSQAITMKLLGLAAAAAGTQWKNVLASEAALATSHFELFSVDDVTSWLNESNLAAVFATPFSSAELDGDAILHATPAELRGAFPGIADLHWNRLFRKLVPVWSDRFPSSASAHQQQHEEVLADGEVGAAMPQAPRRLSIPDAVHTFSLDGYSGVSIKKNRASIVLNDNVALARTPSGLVVAANEVNITGDLRISGSILNEELRALQATVDHLQGNISVLQVWPTIRLQLFVIHVPCVSMPCPCRALLLPRFHSGSAALLLHARARSTVMTVLT